MFDSSRFFNFCFSIKKDICICLHMPFMIGKTDANNLPSSPAGTVNPFWDPLNPEHGLPRNLVFVIYFERGG